MPHREERTRLPEKGPTTGSIIGGIIGAIVLLALIGTAIAMYRKRYNSKLSGDGPPKYKPPPPKKKKNTTSANTELNATPAPAPEDNRLLSNHYYSTQSAEPVTDLDAHNDEENYGAEGAHYYASAPSGWDDPADSDVPPAYVHTGSNHQDYHQGPAVNRGDSFVSPAMLV